MVLTVHDLRWRPGIADRIVAAQRRAYRRRMARPEAGTRRRRTFAAVYGVETEWLVSRSTSHAGHRHPRSIMPGDAKMALAALVLEACIGYPKRVADDDRPSG